MYNIIYIYTYHPSSTPFIGWPHIRIYRCYMVFTNPRPRNHQGKHMVQVELVFVSIGSVLQPDEASASMLDETNHQDGPIS